MNKQIEALQKDLTDIFDEEYYRRNLITPQNTAEKLAEKGYRKQGEVAMEIFADIEKFTYRYLNDVDYAGGDLIYDLAELKKKYIEKGE